MNSLMDDDKDYEIECYDSDHTMSLNDFLKDKASDHLLEALKETKHFPPCDLSNHDIRERYLVYISEWCLMAAYGGKSVKERKDLLKRHCNHVFWELEGQDHLDFSVLKNAFSSLRNIKLEQAKKDEC